jgi:hypothetical protein
MPVPLPEHGPSIDGDHIPFEQIADVDPLGKPEKQVSVAELPLGNGPSEVPVE